MKRLISTTAFILTAQTASSACTSTRVCSDGKQALCDAQETDEFSCENATFEVCGCDFKDAEKNPADGVMTCATLCPETPVDDSVCATELVCSDGKQALCDTQETDEFSCENTESDLCECTVADAQTVFGGTPPTCATLCPENVCDSGLVCGDGNRALCDAQDVASCQNTGSDVCECTFEQSEKELPADDPAGSTCATRCPDAQAACDAQCVTEDVLCSNEKVATGKLTNDDVYTEASCTCDVCDGNGEVCETELEENCRYFGSFESGYGDHTEATGVCVPICCSTCVKSEEQLCVDGSSPTMDAEFDSFSCPGDACPLPEEDCTMAVEYGVCTQTCTEVVICTCEPLELPYGICSDMSLAGPKNNEGECDCDACPAGETLCTDLTDDERIVSSGCTTDSYKPVPEVCPALDQQTCSGGSCPQPAKETSTSVYDCFTCPAGEELCPTAKEGCSMALGCVEECTVSGYTDADRSEESYYTVTSSEVVETVLTMSTDSQESDENTAMFAELALSLVLSCAVLHAMA